MEDIRVAIVAPLTPHSAAEARIRQLVRWTEDALKRLHAEEFASLFLFSAKNAATAPVETFFFSPWAVPFFSDLSP